MYCFYYKWNTKQIYELNQAVFVCICRLWDRLVSDQWCSVDYACITVLWHSERLLRCKYPPIRPYTYWKYLFIFRSWFKCWVVIYFQKRPGHENSTHPLDLKSGLDTGWVEISTSNIFCLFLPYPIISRTRFWKSSCPEKLTCSTCPDIWHFVGLCLSAEPSIQKSTTIHSKLLWLIG
mgnify:CR=1 FL=1